MDDLKNVGAIAANIGLTKRSLREIDALASILERGPTFAELAYQHTVLCQIGLPRRKVEVITSFADQETRSSRSRPASSTKAIGSSSNPFPTVHCRAWHWRTCPTFAVQNRSAVVPIGDTRLTIPAQDRY